MQPPLRGALRRFPSAQRFVLPHRPSSLLPLRHRLPPLHLTRCSSSSVANTLPSSSDSLIHPPHRATMDAQVKQHYLADSPPTVVRLEVKSHFDNLTDPKLRKYAHYLSRCAIIPIAHTFASISVSCGVSLTCMCV